MGIPRLFLLAGNFKLLSGGGICLHSVGEICLVTLQGWLDKSIFLKASERNWKHALFCLGFGLRPQSKIVILYWTVS